MIDRLRPLLTHPRLPLLAAGLALLLTLPSVFTGFAGADWFHRSILLGEGSLAGPAPLTGLFAFLDGGARNQRLIELGVMSWWGDPGALASLFRPIASATHMLDYALWPDSPWLHHLHSLAWFGAGAWLIATLYRRVHPGAPIVAGLAALLFAVEDAHAMPVAWIANRNALITLVFGALAILAHLRWRGGGGIGWLAAALASMCVGLLSGEATLGAAAYIGAWQLTMDEGPRWKRWGAVAPYAARVLVWRGLYNHMGYGASGSGLYIDPGRQLGDFGLALFERWPLMVSGQWLQLPMDAWPFLSRPGQLAMGAAGAAGALLIGWLLLPLLRARAEARFWALGMAVAILPLAAAFPMDRLLLYAGVGAAPLLAMLVTSAPAGLAARGLLVLHLPIAGALLVARVCALPLFNAIFSMQAVLAPTDAAVAGQTLLFVNGNEFATAYTSIIRELDGQGRPPPRRMALLSSQFTDSRVSREDDHTLLITVDEGFLAFTVDRLVREPRLAPFAVGDRFERPDFTAEVRAITGDGRPLTAAFHFPAGLDAPTLRWLAWVDGDLVPFEPPPVGEEALVPRSFPRP